MYVYYLIVGDKSNGWMDVNVCPCRLQTRDEVQVVPRYKSHLENDKIIF